MNDLANYGPQHNVLASLVALGSEVTSGSFTTPLLARWLWVWAGAAGGAGGGASYLNQTDYGSGSGAGPGAILAEPILIPVQGGEVIPWVVGGWSTGGTGIVSGGGQAPDGEDGGDTSFGNYFTLFGGERGKGALASLGVTETTVLGGFEGTLQLNAGLIIASLADRTPIVPVVRGGFASNHANGGSDIEGMAGDNVGFMLGGRGVTQGPVIGGGGAASRLGNGGIPSRRNGAVYENAVDADGYCAGGGGGAPSGLTNHNHNVGSDDGSRGSPGFLIVRALP